MTEQLFPHLVLLLIHNTLKAGNRRPLILPLLTFIPTLWRVRLKLAQKDI